MPSNIPYDRARYKIIKKLQSAQREDSNETLPTAKLILKGKAEIMDIYRFSTQDLLFNKANGRLASEVIAWENEEGHILDPLNIDDQAVLRELLLSLSPDVNKKIQEDLSKNGQIQPGIITCDGIVINGNRRKALLENLYKRTSDEKFLYFEAHVLPTNISKRELWLIEAGIQLSAPQQLDYSPINHLLKLREGINAGLDEKEISSRLYGVSPEQLKRDLNRLKLIDEYLGEFICKEGKYYLVFGLNEHFIDLQNILDWVERPRGAVKKDWDFSSADILELKVVAFHLIRSQFPHLRIRDIKGLFCIKKSWEGLKKSVELVEKNEEHPEEWEETAEDDLEIEDPEDIELEESDNNEEIDIAAKDKHNEKLWIQRNKKVLKICFQDAKEHQEINKDGEKPIALGGRALNNLMAIDPQSQGFPDNKVDEILSKIIKRVNELRNIHHKINHRKQKKTKPSKKTNKRLKNKKGK